MIDWNKKGPLTKEEALEWWSERYAQMSESGIQFFGVLPSPNVGETCSVALALNGKGLPLDQFTSLPLPQCDQQFCRCCLIACETTEWPPLKVS